MNITLKDAREYERFSYPDGAIQVRLMNPDKYRGLAKISILAVIHDAADLMELAQLKSALVGVSPNAAISLALPFLPYARADRRFVPGDCAGLDAFLCLLRAGIGFASVYSLDIHSTAYNIHGNVTNVSPRRLIELAITHFALKHSVSEITVVFPDHGAKRRYNPMIEPKILSHAGTITVHKVECDKTRDAATGKLSGFIVPEKDLMANRPALIVDDICDGGGTFVGIADAMKEYGLNLGLYVTHGIFSKGFEDLAPRFPSIYCSNSLGYSHRKHVHVFDAMPLMLEAL